MVSVFYGQKKSRTAAKPLVWELTVEEQNSNWYFYQLNPRVFEYGVEAGLYRLTCRLECGIVQVVQRVVVVS